MVIFPYFDERITRLFIFRQNYKRRINVTEPDEGIFP